MWVHVTHYHFDFVTIAVTQMVYVRCVHTYSTGMSMDNGTWMARVRVLTFEGTGIDSGT